MSLTDEPKKTEENAKKRQDFDFAGAAYSAVHLPTGLISWLIALPILLPMVAMIVVFECWDTIEAIIRLVHHQY